MKNNWFGGLINEVGRLYNCEKEIKENGIALKIKMDIDYWKRKIVGLFLSLSVCLRW